MKKTKNFKEEVNDLIKEFYKCCYGDIYNQKKFTFENFRLWLDGETWNMESEK
jgi:hypothetical protein